MQYFPKINGSGILIPIIAHTQNKVKINLYKNGNIIYFFKDKILLLMNRNRSSFLKIYSQKSAQAERNTLEALGIGL